MKKNRIALCIDNSGLSGKNEDIKIQIGNFFFIKNETQEYYSFEGFPSNVKYFKYRFIELSETQAESRLIKLMVNI